MPASPEMTGLQQSGHAALNRQIIRGTSQGKIIWQPRILCWYYDRQFRNEPLPPPYTGMGLDELYRALGCSNRLYDHYNTCIEKVFDPRVRNYQIPLSETETQWVLETPVGKVTQIIRNNSSNYGTFPKKWWVTTPEDLRVVQWFEETSTWRFHQEIFDARQQCVGDLGMPVVFIERISIQRLFIDLMGVEAAIYALYDFPEVVESYFHALSESHERLIEVINASPLELINFGDNVHAGLLPPELFKKYALPEYEKRNHLLHQADKFTFAHWDGDVKALLPYARHCGFDGIEAITPQPQGDVTLAEVKEAFGDALFLFDGIAALLFEERYPLKELEKQAKEAIALFAPKLVLGISDELSSLGSLERVRFVGELVEEYNAAGTLR